jgi:hypothetical protein
MMAPKFERLRDLQEVLSEAAYMLDHPIDRIEVLPHAIRVTAGPQAVDVRLDYSGMTDAAGVAMPGSPSRSCRFGQVATQPGFLARLGRRLGL